MPISLLGWIARALLVTTLLLLAATYGRGLALVSSDQAPRRWQPPVFFLGLIMLAATLVSPLETLVAKYYTARALQQLFLTEMIPFLLLASNPFRPIFTGLPAPIRTRLHPLRNSPTIRALTMPAAAWLFFVTTFWFWHDASMIEIVSRNGWMHVVEIGSLLLVSSLYWWHIVAAEPRIHPPMSLLVRLMYAFIGILPIKLTGIVMLFGIETRVGGYNLPDENTLLVNFFGAILPDKTAGSIVIWVVGGIMYATAALLLASRYFGREESKPELPVNPIEDEDLWVAPGIGRQPPRNVYGLKGGRRKG